MTTFTIHAGTHAPTYLAESSREIEYVDKGLCGEVQFSFYLSKEERKEELGWFFLSPLPGCCGVVVSHGSFLLPQYRASDIGDAFHRMKTKVAQELGYSAMISTTQLKNIPQIVGGAKHGWKYCETFRNKRTNNEIGIGIKLI